MRRAVLQPVVLAASVSEQRRWWNPFVGPNRFALPGQPQVTKEEIEETVFRTKSRGEWPYKAIDESITNVSEFNNMRARPDFDGPREDNSVAHNASLNAQPHHKRLHEYFDEYTQPGSDPKMMAVQAVREHWDAKEFYYPGEAWQRNRPSFRSVPAELLNKQTWYHWMEMAKKCNEMSTSSRHRAWNPIWPPPGYKVPKFWTKREFIFGAEEPGLLAEVERWQWHKQWFESNQRHGPWEALLWVLTLSFMYDVIKRNQCYVKMKSMFGNLYYPGKQYFRSYGEPKDWETEIWWWQCPLEEIPNRGEVWYNTEVRFKYINHIKQRDEEDRLRKELGEAAV